MNSLYSKTSFIVNRKASAKALNIILSNSLTYLKADFLKNDDLRITIQSSKKIQYQKVFYENGINLTFEKEKGILAFLKRKRYRLGFLLGFIFLILSLYISSKFVWKINVFGNTVLTEDEVISELNDASFHLGSYIPSIDYKDLHNKILLSSDKISWISINIDGNVANVVIKEKLDEKPSDNIKYSNIIAKSDGQIVSISIEDGEKQISVGDIVKKGDILISGVLDSQSQGVRYVNAKGNVRAYVNKIIEIKMPFMNNEKVYTGKVYTDKYYKIFNYLIKFSSKCRNYSVFCDTIETTKQISLFNKVKLPVFCTKVKHLEYENVNVEYTKEQVIDISFKKLREEMDKSLENAELITKTIKTDFDGTYFYVYCDLYCVENIAQEVQFYVIK